MTGTTTLLALLAQAAAAPQPATPRLHCDARTVSGAALSFTWDTLAGGGQALPLITGRGRSAFPKDGETFVLPPRGQGSVEDEFQSGPQIVRLEREGAVRDLTIWSARDGKPFAPVAFGFCVAPEIAAPASVPADDAKAFEPIAGDEGCHLTTVEQSPRHGRFAMRSDAKDGKFISSFTGLASGAEPNIIAVPRELLGKPPKAAHPGINLQVARFRPQPGEAGPTGMEAGYIDGAAKRLTILVKFNDLDGKGMPAFGICSAAIDKMENVQ